MGTQARQNYLRSDKIKINDPTILHKIQKIVGSQIGQISKKKYLIGPFYAGPNLTPAPFTPALIAPEANFGLTPIRAAYYAKEKG